MWVGSGVFAKSSIIILNNFKDDERQVDVLGNLGYLLNCSFLSFPRCPSNHVCMTPSQA